MTDRLTDADLDAIAEQIGCPSAVQAVQIGEYEACARSLVEHGAGKLLAEVRRLRAAEAARQRVITDVPALLAEVRRLREEARAFAEALEFGNDRTEPAATLTEMLDPIEQAFGEARDHAECPVVCELCGERLAWQLCEKCYGSGCLSNAALAYLECDECAGAGMIHPDCAERTYAELAAEVRRLRAASRTFVPDALDALETILELHSHEVYDSHRRMCSACGGTVPCATRRIIENKLGVQE